MVLVIDIQGFLLNDGYLVKELAISDGNMINHYLFKPDVPYNRLTSKEKQQIQWLENNHHTLRYSDGHVNLSELKGILQRFTAKSDLIFVKGHQKVNVLKKYGVNTPIINLEYVQNAPKLVQTKSACCFYHKNNLKICSISNVNILSAYLFSIT